MNYKKAYLAVVIAGLLISAAALAVIIPNLVSALRTSTKITTVQQPASASLVAASIECGNFVDLGDATNVGVVDSGACFIGTQKYAINTFASKASRDSWLKAAEPLGVTPQWETDTSVVYPSVT